jgi:uncharacterized protein YkwD
MRLRPRAAILLRLMGGMLSRGIAAVAVFVCAVAVPATAAPAKARASAADSLERALLAHVNAFRAQHGLRPLRPYVRLAAVAGAHSRAMARDGFIAHRSADGSAAWQRIRRY